jgi:hypothetical protein
MLVLQLLMLLLMSRWASAQGGMRKDPTDLQDQSTTHQK